MSPIPPLLPPTGRRLTIRSASFLTCPPHWAPNALSVCTFHVPLAYQRCINTFLVWHSGEKGMPNRCNYTPNSLKVKYGPLLSGDTGNTKEETYSERIKTRCGSWNWNWAWFVWMAVFNLHLLKATISFGDMQQCRIPWTSADCKRVWGSLRLHAQR